MSSPATQCISVDLPLPDSPTMATSLPFTSSARTYLAARAEPFDRGFAMVGIPLGYAMGLNNWFRGWFDPIVEFMRPVPPLALIPLIIIWMGIGEDAKIILLFN